MKKLFLIALVLICTCIHRVQAQVNATTPQCAWAAVIDHSGQGRGADVATNAYGDVALISTFKGALSIGDTVINSLSNTHDDAYVTLHDSAGNFKWVRRIGGTNSDLGSGVALDDSGNVYACGSFRDVIYLDTFQL